MAAAATPIRFQVRKYGPPRGIDASSWPAWTGIVANGERHVLDFVEVLVVRSGQGTLHASGQRHRLAGPSLVVTRPAVERRVVVGTPLDLDVVVFPERGVHRVGVAAMLAGVPTGAVEISTGDARDLTAVGTLLHQELAAGRDDAPLMLDALLTQFLLRLRRAWPARRPRVTPRLLSRFEDLLEQRFREDHGVAAYAGRLGVSADHLSAIARGLAGCSAKTLIERRLMREATDLLAGTDRRIADIAADLGYDEPTHFARAFKRWSGLSPHRLRSGR